MEWRKKLNIQYPQALSFDTLAENTKKLLNTHGFTPENTLFANCTCRDEINKKDISLFADYWGENFELGGIGGYPSSGMTALNAYTHHTPDNGNLLILYGPHIGINSQGEFGKVKRAGMEKESSSCGALMGFVANITNNKKYSPKFDEWDAEQYLVENALIPYADKIVQSTDPVLSVTEHMFQAIDQALTTIIDRAKPPFPLALLGGITINVPEGIDHFITFKAKIVDWSGGTKSESEWITHLR